LAGFEPATFGKHTSHHTTKATRKPVEFKTHNIHYFEVKVASYIFDAKLIILNIT
jgi:hypothetical protein